MKTVNQGSCLRRIIGDILLVLAVLLMAHAVVVMLRKINAVVLKADYQKVFTYELILCAFLLLFALDVRFNLFTRAISGILRVIGWVPRTFVVLLALPIVFFSGDLRQRDEHSEVDRLRHRARTGAGERKTDGRAAGKAGHSPILSGEIPGSAVDTDRGQRGCVGPYGGCRHARDTG